MEFRILGPLEVRDGERVLPLGGARRRAVLALLLLDANHVVSVDRLVDGVWGDTPPSSALASLQNHLARLRQELGERLVTQSPGYVLRVADGELDLDRFRRLVDDAHGAEPAVAADRLAGALALWRGPPLADLAGEPAGQAAAHLEELRLAALEERIEADLALGRHAALVPELEELVAAEAYRESFRRQLIVALYRSGRQADALEAYTQARRTLVDELGTEPGRELQEIHRAVLRQDPALDVPAGAEPPPARPPRAEERKTVTVLAADITPDDLSDDPEARRAQLRERSATAEGVLETHGATVQNLGGGRLLGVFGVPTARDDDALQAARAAVALGPAARVGLATGEVVTGDPLVSGPPVEEAVSLRDRAEMGEVLVGFRTWRLVRHAVTGSQRDGSWVVEAVDPEAAPLLRRLETPIVGRRQRARAGRGGVRARGRGRAAAPRDRLRGARNRQDAPGARVQRAPRRRSHVRGRPLPRRGRGGHLRPAPRRAGGARRRRPRRVDPRTSRRRRTTARSSRVGSPPRSAWESSRAGPRKRRGRRGASWPGSPASGRC